MTFADRLLLNLYLLLFKFNKQRIQHCPVPTSTGRPLTMQQTQRREDALSQFEPLVDDIINNRLSDAAADEKLRQFRDFIVDCNQLGAPGNISLLSTAEFRTEMGSIIFDPPDIVMKFKHDPRTATSSAASKKLTVFHGSPLVNWYSILFNNFDLDRSSPDSLFGVGIYFARDERVARAFASFESFQLPDTFKEKIEGKISIIGVFNIDLQNARPGDVVLPSSATDDDANNAAHRSVSNSSSNPTLFGEMNLPSKYLIVRSPNIISIAYLLIYCDERALKNINAVSTPATGVPRRPLQTNNRAATFLRWLLSFVSFRTLFALIYLLLVIWLYKKRN